MRVHLVLLLPFVAAVTLAACGDAGDPTTTTRTTTTGSASVLPLEYTRAGGVGGVNTKLTIDAGGAANLDGFAFTLTDDERAQLALATKDVDFAANAGKDRGDPHPDAFVYSLRVDGRDILLRDYVIPTPLGALVSALERLAANHSPARRQEEAEARKYLVVLYRSGGIAGGHLSLKVAEDGNARISFEGDTEQTFRVDAEHLAALADALQGDPEDLRSPRDPNLVVADGFEYVVMTRGVTITAGDPVENERLGRLVGVLGEIAEGQRPPVE